MFFRCTCYRSWNRGRNSSHADLPSRPSSARASGAPSPATAAAESRPGSAAASRHVSSGTYACTFFLKLAGKIPFAKGPYYIFRQRDFDVLCEIPYVTEAVLRAIRIHFNVIIYHFNEVIGSRRCLFQYVGQSDGSDYSSSPPNSPRSLSPKVLICYSVKEISMFCAKSLRLLKQSSPPCVSILIQL